MIYYIQTERARMEQVVLQMIVSDIHILQLTKPEGGVLFSSARFAVVIWLNDGSFK